MTEQEKSRVFEKTLPVSLNDEERLHRANELASLLAEITTERAAASDAAKRSKERVARLNLRVNELGAQLRAGSEERLVDCEEILDYRRNCAETLRIDTGEIVDSRPLRPEEMQTRLTVVEGDFNPERVAETATGRGLDALGLEGER